jgi:hypothetical protein
VASTVVTATLSGAGGHNGIILTVKALTGQAASPAGNTASSATITTPQLAITPSGTGSWVYGSLANLVTDASFTANSSTTFSQNFLDTSDTITMATFRSTGTTTSGTPVTLGATNPTESTRYLMIAMAEILQPGRGEHHVGRDHRHGQLHPAGGLAPGRRGHL